MCLAIKPSSIAVPTMPAITALRDPPESRRPQLISLDLICGLVSNHPSLTPGAKILEKLPLEMTLRRPMCSRSYLSRRFGGLAVLKEWLIFAKENSFADGSDMEIYLRLN